MKGIAPGAREHHYRFAHKVLPTLAFDNPRRLKQILETPVDLARLWYRSADKLPPADQLPPDGLTSEPHWFEAQKLLVLSGGTGATAYGEKWQFFITLVSLPLPCRMVEAYLCALVIGPVKPLPRLSPSQCLERATNPPVRYFTLEFGVTEDFTGTRTILAEAFKDGNRVNYGDGPAPTTADFYRRVCRELRQSL